MHLNKYLAVAALCGIVTSCQLEPLEIPSQELYTREFIKSYGLINPEQDWSVVKRASVTVTTMTATDVQILCREDGKTKLLGYFKGVAGSRTLEFDCPKPIEEVLVKGGDAFEIVPLGGELTIAPVVSRAANSTAAIDVKVENGYYWSNANIKGIIEKLPEGDPTNLVNKSLISDFSFVSDGTEFALYPIYWQTTAKDVLGIYWFEDGTMKTKDIFWNHTTQNMNGEDVLVHNIYHRPTKGSVLVPTYNPKWGNLIPITGTIVYTFNRRIEINPNHKAYLEEVDAGNNPTGKKYELQWKQAGYNNDQIIYSYSNLPYDKDLIFYMEDPATISGYVTEGDKNSSSGAPLVFDYKIPYTTEGLPATAVKFNFTFEGTSNTIEPSTIGESIVENNEFFQATLIYNNGFNPLVTFCSDPKLEFKLPGSNEVTTFDYGIRTKYNDKLFDNKITESSISEGQYSFVKIVPNIDMTLTAYGFIEQKDYYDSDGNKKYKPEQTYISLHNNTDGVGVEATLHTSTDKKDSEGALLEFQQSRFQVVAGKEYVVYYPKNTQGRLAGFACQKLEANKAPRRVGSRSGEDEIDWANLSTSGLDGQRIWDGNGVPGHDFIRTPLSSKLAVSEDEKDDVITHRVSFTLPKGVIFGFYLRNENGASNITGVDSDHPGMYTNYSMSRRNKEVENSFFNSLGEFNDSKYFTEGWGTRHPTASEDKAYHDKLKKGNEFILPPESRKYSTAMTYTVGDKRYFSFEDWVDVDFNDIAFMVAPESENTEIVDGDIETNPYIFAVEDLGAIADSDIDFNDVVFAVEHVAGSEEAFVTMLAAGGTLPVQLFYNGYELDGSGGVNGEVVGGLFVGAGRRFDHVNKWFGHDAKNAVVGVGNGSRNVDYGNVTTMKIPVDPSFTLTDKAEATEGKVLGFSVKVDRGDGTYEEVTRPDATGEAPQMIILPGTWAWPLEKMPISGAYPGGISSNGEVFPSFQDWVNDGDGKGYQNANWHKAPSRGRVVEHPWDGSDAARKAFSELEQAD